MYQINQRKLILASYWLSSIVDGAARIVIPLYFASIGVSASSIGLMFLAYESAGLISNFYSGYFINRFGYRAGLLTGLLLQTGASIGYISLSSDTYVIAAIVIASLLRASRGVGKELMKTTVSAYCRNLPKQREHKLSRLTQLLLGGKDAMKGLGIMLGGFLLAFVGFNQLFAIFGAVTLVSLLFVYRYLKDFRETKRQVTFAGFVDVKHALSVLAVSRALLYAGRDCWIPIAIPIALLELNVSSGVIGLTLAIGLVMFGVMQPLTSEVLTKHWQRIKHNVTYKQDFRRLSTASYPLLAVTMLPIWYQPDNVAVLIACVIVFNIVAGIATAPHNYLHLAYSRKERAAIDITYYKSVAQVGKVLAVAVSGIIYHYYGIVGCVIVAMSCLMCASLLAYYLDFRQSYIKKFIQMGT